MKKARRTGTREKAEGAAMGTILVHLPKKRNTDKSEQRQTESGGGTGTWVRRDTTAAPTGAAERGVRGTRKPSTRRRPEKGDRSGNSHGGTHRRREVRMERQRNDASDQGEATTLTRRARKTTRETTSEERQLTPTPTPLDWRCMPHIPHGSPIPPQRRGAAWRPNNPAPREFCISRMHTRGVHASG